MSKKHQTTITSNLRTPRIVDYMGQAMFLAEDVARELGFSRPMEAIRQICRKPVGVFQPSESEWVCSAPTPGTEILISISDVTRLVMNSDLPEAELFLDYLEEALSGQRLPSISSLFATR